MEHVLKNGKLYLIAVLMVAASLTWYAVAAEERSGVLTFAVLDVGQGDAIFIESPSGTQILVDGGPNGAVLREVGEVMPFYDRTLDLLVVTNPDKDHFAGFIDVLRAYEVERVLEPGTTGAASEYSLFQQAIENEGAQHMLARRGQVYDLGGGATLAILFPDRDVSGLDTNDGSIVAKLTYKATSFLLTGDTTSAVEEYLAHLDKERLDVDVLKVGHHGSKTSTSDALLGFASPSIAVISAGRDNKYGHPHSVVTERLSRFEAETLGTYERGTIILESDGSVVKVLK